MTTNYNKDQKVRITPYQARIVTEELLHEFRFLPDWKGAFTKRVFPIFTPNYKNDNQYYEVKISTPYKNDSGTVLVSAYKNDYPVQCFKTRGKSFYEQVKIKSDLKAIKAIWQGGTCFTGVDEKDKELIVIGNKQKIKFNIKEFGNLLEKNKPKLKLKIEDSIKQEWDELEPYLNRQKAPGNPTLGVEFHLIKGWSRNPNLDQYDLPNGEQIGCGPAAWAQYLSYHDMYWQPDLLYGIYDNITLPYIKKLMQEIHGACGTGDFLGIDGFTYPSDMKKGAEVFSKYLLFSNSYDMVNEYDLSVILMGSDPGSNVLTNLISLVNYNEPAIIGLWYHSDDKSKKDKDKSGKVGHYCLCMGYSLNANGNLKFAFVDENHGNAYHDWVWWHRQHIFGVWGIKRASYTSQRTSYEADVNFSSIDMTQLNHKIYLAGCKLTSDSEPKLVIRKASTNNYPHPQCLSSGGRNPEKLRYEEEIEISMYELQHDKTPINGSISICAWNDKEPIVLQHKAYIDQLKKFLHIKDEFIQEKSFIQNPFDPSKWFATEDIPYLFICWRDINQRIHIAFTIIQGLLPDCIFNHIILPGRFKTTVDPSIAIAEGDIKTPLFYIAFVNDHPIMEGAPGSHYFGGSALNAGQLLIITLKNLFKFATTGEDLWPTDYVTKVIWETRTIMTHMGSVTNAFVKEFIENWWVFDAPVTYVNLSSDNKEVALLWSSSNEYNPFSDEINEVLKLSVDYSFSNTNEHLISLPLPVNPFNTLKIVFSRYNEPFLDMEPNFISSGYSGSEKIGSISIPNGSKPDLLFIPGTSQILLCWNDNYNMLYVGRITKASKINEFGNRDYGYLIRYHLVQLLNDLFKIGKYPLLQFINDTMGNKNFVLSYLHGTGFKALSTRFLYLDIDINANHDDLPR